MRPVQSGGATGTFTLLCSLVWLLGACATAPDPIAAPAAPAGKSQPTRLAAKPAARPPATNPTRQQRMPSERGPVLRPLAALPESGLEAFPPMVHDELPEELEDSIIESHVGLASWYGRRFHGRRTASGERFDMAALTAAHQTLPFGSRVRVTNLDNGRSVIVVINDRGPFVKTRVIDLSHAAAKQLGFLQDGLARVRIEVLGGPTG